MMKRTIRFGLFLTALTLIAAAVWAGAGQDKLKGKDFTYGNWWADWSTDTFEPTNEIGEMMLEWRTRIQREHGFTMREKMVGDWGGMMPALTSSIMAGKPEAQIFVLSPAWAMSMHRQGLLFPISDSKAVDLTTTEAIAQRQVSYNQDVAKRFTFGGKQYALAIGYGGSGHATGIFFNKRLFREAGLDPDLPYNMQKDGTWTWDNFFDICKRLTRDRSNSGRIDTWAMPADHATNILRMFVFSNGGDFITQDNSGRFANASGRPEFLEAFQFARRLLDEGVLMPRPENSNWDWNFPVFHDGICAMLVGDDYQRDSLRNMADDWGWVLGPKGPRANDYRFPTDENVIGVASSYKLDEVDAILTAFNLWSTPVSTDWKAGLWNAYRDTRAVDETSAMIRSPRYGAFQAQIMIPGLEIGDIAWQLWWYDGDPSQLIESVSPSWNALISDANSIGR